MDSIRAVDLFAGAGGGSIGLDSAGVDVVGAVDNDEKAVETYADNPVDIDPWLADLTKVDFDDIANHFNFDSTDVDLVMGCPPCQNFSSLRDTSPWDDDEPKDELLKAFYHHVREALPDYVLFENVPGICHTEEGIYLEWLQNRMRELGYGMTVKVVNAADYGVPQVRRRTIGLFVKGVADENISLPEPTHALKERADQTELPPRRTVRDAIEDLSELAPGEKSDSDPAHRARNHRTSTLEIIRAVPEDGGSRTDIEDDDLILDCHKRLDGQNTAGNIYGRMAWDAPAPTLTTRCTSPSGGRFVHPEQDRGMSFREAARLMGFPDFPLPETNSAAERVVGNAVPPRLIKIMVQPIFKLASSEKPQL